MSASRPPAAEAASGEAPSSPWMDEELAIMRAGARRFIEKEFAPRMPRWTRQGRVDREAWNRAGEAGLLCASIPREWGGGGGSFLHEMVVIEELARANVTGFGNGVHSGIVAHYINAYGTEGQKRRWLPKMASGELVGAIAMSEPGAGSDLQALATAAVPRDGRYWLSGQKTFITNGQSAELICVAAKTDPAGAARGISLLMVEADPERPPEGFSRGRNLEKMGLKAQDTSELFFDDVEVPAGNLLGGEEGRGFAQLMEQLPQERLVIAAGACAAIETAMRLTLEYVKERKAFGRRIIDFQNTQFRLAERQTEARLARLLVDDCAARLVEGRLDAAGAAMAKWWTTQKQCEIVDECLQFFGGYGYMMEYPIAQMYLDSRVQKIYGGSNEIMKMLIAREL